jgi:hypothetical protein
MPLKTTLLNTLITGAVAVGALALTSTPASAYVACNRFGDCWHVRDHYDYPAPVGVVVHEDGWVFDKPGYYHWAKDRPGRGYWDHGHWRRF